MEVELRVLGALDVVGPDGPIPVPGRKKRRLLAALALADGRACSRDELVEAVWGASAPRSAPKLVQVYVSQLRKTLPRGIRIVTTSWGYGLEFDGATLDSDSFTRLADDASEALAAGNAELAVSLAQQALGLWRGQAYADVVYEDFARGEALRLEELRLGVEEDRLEALLQLGRHDDALGDVLALADAEPTRERAQELALVALYRAGRQTEALDLYAALRDRLDEELGLEPTAALRGLQRRILQQDPSLDAPPRPAAPGRRVALPAALTPLVGRERELEALGELLARRTARLLVLTGAGGSGKTRLALEAARRAGPTFANGVAVVELAPLRDPGLVPHAILSALAIAERSGDEVTEALVHGLEAREQLLVIDNVEHLREAAPLFVELVSRAPRVTLLVTSRAVLHVSGEHVFPVHPLDVEDAVELFEQRTRSRVPEFRRTDENDAAIAAVCDRVDRLPLAIELAAGRMGTVSLSALTERLGDRLAVLTGGPRDLPARQQTLRETLDWSVGLLTPTQRSVLARLAVFPAGASLEAAEQVCGAELDTLAALVDAHLVRRVDVGDAPRFGLLETVREYALELLGDERAETDRALIVHLLGLVEAAEATQTEDPVWMTRFDVELDNLRAALDAAAQLDPGLEVQLAGGLWRYWWTRGFLDEGLTRLESCLARTAGTTAGRVRALRGAAGLAWSRGDLQLAIERAAEALAGAREIGNAVEQLAAHTILGLVANQRNDFDLARAHHRRSLELKRELGLSPATEMLNLGIVELDSGDPGAAVELFHEVLEIHRRNDTPSGIGFASLNLGIAHLQRVEPEVAETWFLEARSAFVEVGFRSHAAHALQGLAACAAADGRNVEAARLLGQAAGELGELTESEEFFPRLASEVEADLRRALGDDDYDAVFASAL